MPNVSVKGLYFSPSGSTRKTIESMIAAFPQAGASSELLSFCEEEKIFEPNTLLVIGIPVFAGRVPQPCIDAIQKLSSSGSPAIAVAVYGNRDIDDALLELSDLLEQQGFAVIAAAAVVAQHSIFPKVAAGRPDEDDLRKLKEFTLSCQQKLDASSGKQTVCLNIRGNRPYRTPALVPLKPSADRSCTHCGACAKRCPVHAINPVHPESTDKKLCISCTACIAVCPQNARAFRGPAYQVAAKGFAMKFSSRREPEFFL